MTQFNKLPNALSPIVRDMCRVGEYASRYGWAEMNAGNMSIDVTHMVGQKEYDLSHCRTVPFAISIPSCANRSFLVTCAGSRFRDMADEPAATIMLIHVSATFDRYAIVWGGSNAQQKATSELATHLGIQAHLCDTQKHGAAILHTHPTHLIALTHIEAYCNKGDLDRLLRSMHPEIAMVMPMGIGFVPYHEPGSDNLAIATIKAMSDHRIVVWEKHGCVAIGDTIQQAFDLIEVCNKAAEIFFLCKSTGYDVQGLREEDLRALQKLYKPSR